MECGSCAIKRKGCYSDWQTGRIEDGRVAQVAPDSGDELLRRLPLLAARLTGSLPEVGPGPNVTLSPLPGGVNDLSARILQLDRIEEELKTAQKTLADKHPRLVFLRDKYRDLGKVLATDVDNKIAEIEAEDGKFAELYQIEHTSRQALREQLRDLKAAREGVLTWACHTAEVELQYRRKITEDEAVLEKLRHQVENPPE